MIIPSTEKKLRLTRDCDFWCDISEDKAGKIGLVCIQKIQPYPNWPNIWKYKYIVPIGTVLSFHQNKIYRLSHNRLDLMVRKEDNPNSDIYGFKIELYLNEDYPLEII